MLLNLSRESFEEPLGLVREVVGQKQALSDDGVSTHLAGSSPLLVDQLRDGIAELTVGIAVGEAALLDTPERHAVVEGTQGCLQLVDALIDLKILLPLDVFAGEREACEQ